MSLSRAEDRRRYRDDRKRIFKKVFWLIAIVTVGGTLGTWLWEWTGEPVFFE